MTTEPARAALRAQIEALKTYTREGILCGGSHVGVFVKRADVLALPALAGEETPDAHAAEVNRLEVEIGRLESLLEQANIDPGDAPAQAEE